MANACFKRGLAKKKTSKAMTSDNGAVDDDFDIKQELLKKRGAEGMNLKNLSSIRPAATFTKQGMMPFLSRPRR